MKKTTLPIETIVENQNKLVETITANNMKAMEIFKVEDAWTKKGKELFEAYVKEQKELTDKVAQPATFEKGFEGVTEQMTKAFEMNWNYANKTMEFCRETMTSMTEGKVENPFTRMFDLYNDNMHAMLDATKKNLEAFRTPLLVGVADLKLSCHAFQKSPVLL